jgi:hypothetical protein
MPRIPVAADTLANADDINDLILVLVMAKVKGKFARPLPERLIQDSI